MSVLATWYTGSIFTSWAGFAVEYGQIAFYVTAYATMTMIVMYFVATPTFVWGTKYGLKTQSELVGFRYQSKTLRMLTGVWGILFTIPWLIVELVTQGYVFNYATDGLVSTFWGMVIGVIVVAIFVAMGGMKSVITANIVEGIIMLVGTTSLLIFFTYKFFGGYEAGFQMIADQYPEMLTYPGPGWNPPTPYFTSLVLLGGFGGFMWPWVYNKLFAANSVRSIKKIGLVAPILGAIFWAIFVYLGFFLHLKPEALANVQGSYLWIAKEAGQFALGFLGLNIMSKSIGTTSGIIQAISTTISRDLVQVIQHSISEEAAVKIARYSVIVIAIISILCGMADLGLMVFLAIFSYNGIIMLFPVVVLGLYWKRANKEGAIIALLAGTGFSMALAYFEPGFISGWGWQPGMYGMLLSFVIIIIAGYAKKPDAFVNQLWGDLDLAHTLRSSGQRMSA